MPCAAPTGDRNGGHPQRVALIVIGVGLCVAVLALLYFPKDGAAQFFGAFLAAIVAAGAVIGNAYYQARLVRERDDRISAQRSRADLVRLIGFVSYAYTRSAQVEVVIKGAIESARAGSSSPRDAPVMIKAGTLQAIGLFDFRESLDSYLQIASELPVDLAQ